MSKIRRMTMLSTEDMGQINLCAQQIQTDHSEAKYWITWRLHGDPYRILMFKLCEDCSQKVRTHPDLIKIESIPREPLSS